MPLTPPLPMGLLARALLAAGLVAGLVTGAFHLVVSEPFVDRALALEEQAQERDRAASGSTEPRPEPVLSRRTQKGGLIIGTLGYGVAAGSIFAGVYALIGARLPGRGHRARVAALGVGAVLAAVLLPFLKYPANPPGVGDPETLTRRQLLYVACLLLAIAGLWLAVRVQRVMAARSGTGVGIACAAGFFVLWSAALLLFLPARTDPVHTPARLLWEYRAASLAGQVLFWTLFCALFAMLLTRDEQPAAVSAASY